MAEPARETSSPRPTPASRGAAKRRQSLEPREQEMVLHGHRLSYRTAGPGPVVLLIHGITGSSEQWNDVFPLLAERYTVVAPDLLGHGRSAKPRGDHSLGAYAVGIRDLLIALGHRRVTRCSPRTRRERLAGVPRATAPATLQSRARCARPQG